MLLRSIYQKMNLKRQLSKIWSWGEYYGRYDDGTKCAGLFAIYI